MQTDEWTDARLDDLVNRLADSLDGIDADIRELRVEVSGARRDGLFVALAIVAAIIGTGVLT